jgi:hypothetical protein
MSEVNLDTDSHKPLPVYVFNDRVQITGIKIKKPVCDNKQEITLAANLTAHFQ